ncbi:MAG: alpha/beta hydrolase family protein, partial [Gaiellaceae bacterium]
MSTDAHLQVRESEASPEPSMLERLRAAKRALIVLSGLLDVRLLSPAVNAVTRRPLSESVDIAGVPTELVTPAGTGPWPAFVLVTGAHPLRRREPIVMKVAEGLGRAGFVVLVPDLPGLGEGQISPHTVESTVRVVEWTSGREDVAAGQIVLCGASVGGSLALIVAGRPEVADSISVVSSICPFADLEKMICLATTRCYGHDGPVGAYDAAILLRRVVARSLLATLPEGGERTELLDRVGDILNDQADPIDGLLALDVEELSPDARPIVRLLTNTDAGQF